MYAIRLRRGTDAEWRAENPKLLAGEIVYSTDSRRFKIGDGVKVWSDLSYVVGISAAGLSITGSVKTYTDLLALTDVYEKDFFVVTDDPDPAKDGHGYLRVGPAWVDTGPIQGPQGPAGVAGTNATWQAMTQSEYDALKAAGNLVATTLYVIIV